ncbi:MAG: hypothetical protein QOI55_1785 [Actinomycetota bacterium]|nr:hypothetical protein [Actinomycetota bacterium]
MGLVERTGSSTAPIVVDGRTVTMRARTWAVPVHLGDLHLWFARSRPDHVEILETDGRHRTMRVHDVTHATRLAVTVGSLSCVIAARLRRRASRERSEA